MWRWISKGALVSDGSLDVYPKGAGPAYPISESSNARRFRGFTAELFSRVLHV